MSPSELLRETGLQVSTRQFRRYMANRIITGIRRGKRGHYVVVGPVTPKRIAEIQRRVLHFRCGPGRKRLKYIPPVPLKSRAFRDVTFSRVNLAGALTEFGWWMDQSEPVDRWSDAKKREVLRELIPAAVVAARLANDLQQEIPKWDGTKHQLCQFRS
jgi:hypothetical protein